MCLVPGFPKQPPSMAQDTGRGPGRDSGGREINFGPDMGTPDALDKPEYLSPDAERLWDALILELKGSGVLRSVDSTALAACCETYSRWRAALQLRAHHGVTHKNRFGDTVRAPWVGVEAESSKELRSWLREFGLTPSALTNLLAQTPQSDPDSPFVWAQPAG